MKTAIEWLANQIENDSDTHFHNINWDKFDELINQAKEMEKEQIINAREDGHISTYAEYGETPKCYLDGGHEQYYNETYKSE